MSHHNCHTLDYETLLVYIEQIISRKLLCGELQAGLLDCCGDTILPKGTQLVSCKQLNDLVQDAIDEGEITFPSTQSLTLDECVLTLVDHNGKELTADLSPICDRIIVRASLDGDDQLVLTRGDGSTTTADLSSLRFTFTTDSVNGDGTRGSPLAVNEDWLQSLVQALIDDGTISIPEQARIVSGRMTDDRVLVLTRGDGTTVEVDYNSFVEGILGDTEARIVSGRMTDDRRLILTRSDGTEVAVNYGPFAEQLLEEAAQQCTGGVCAFAAEENGLRITLCGDCEAIEIPWAQIADHLDGLIEVNTGDSINGDGTEDNPLVINQEWLNEFLNDWFEDRGVAVDADSCISGNGTQESPLTLDQTCLNELIDARINETGINVSSDSCLTGDGSEEEPLGISIPCLADALFQPEQSDFYIDAENGSDDNPGTREEPLRTIGAAPALMESPVGAYTILLKAGQVHDLDRGDFGERTLRVYHYGDPNLPDGNQTPCPQYYSWYSQELNRPILSIGEYVSDDDGSVLRRQLSAQQIVFRGVQVRSAITQEPDRGLRHAVGARGGADFQGVYIEPSDININTGMIIAPTATMSGIRIIGNGAEPIFHDTLAPTITENGFGFNETCPGHPTITGIPFGNVQALPLDRLISDRVDDPATKTQFNYRTAWDPWA